MATYAFSDTMCAISGPNGAFNLGFGTGNTEGGITVTMTEDKATLTVGADGETMFSLHSGRAGTVTIRLLKTSPTNSLLSAMYASDTASGFAYGKNTISIRDLSRGDVITCQNVGFQKFADITFGKEGGEMTWAFISGKIDFVLGTGIAVAA